MACKDWGCQTCRPFQMVEWGMVKAWRMREMDDEGIGGLKNDSQLWDSPYGWLRSRIVRGS